MKIFNRIIRRLRRNKNEARAFISTVVAKCVFHANDITYGANLQVRGKLYIDNAGTVVVGNNVTINSANWANPIGGGNRTELQIRGGVLQIGDNCGISNTAITCAERINIGNNVLIGAGCKIYDTDFHPLEARWRYGEYLDNTYAKSKQITIEDGAFIGALL